jgi:lipopolysaccharide export system protein LptC
MLITLTSSEGRIDGATEARLSGQVRIETSDGYTMQTEALSTALDATRIVTQDTVTARGPLGEITAGRMEITAENADSAAVMVFKDGVRLIYLPQSEMDRN